MVNIRWNLVGIIHLYSFLGKVLCDHFGYLTANDAVMAVLLIIMCAFLIYIYYNVRPLSYKLV